MGEKNRIEHGREDWIEDERKDGGGLPEVVERPNGNQQPHRSGKTGHIVRMDENEQMQC